MTKVYFTHVNYEWQTFIVPDYKNASTICGVKSARYGIPGISDIPVDTWCPRCARLVAGTAERLGKDERITNEHVKALYSEAWLITYPYLAAYVERQARERAERLARKESHA